MPDISGSKISDLPAASSPNTSDVLAGVQSGTTKKFSLSVLKSFFINGLTKANVGLGNVDNTSDANKPVSAAQQAAIAAAVQEAESAIPAASSADPQMDGTANAGSATTWSRGDHVHPSDTSRVPTTRTVNGKALSADLVLDAVGSITLSLSWSGSGPYTQVVTVTGATISSNSKVDLQSTPAQIEQLISDGVEALVIENNAGTLTATAIGAAPSTALTLQCTVTEVSA